MENLNNIKPFDIVVTPYRDLEGKLKTNPDGSIQAGMFMVLYIDSVGMLTCAKITSQYSKYINGFCYNVSQDNHIFLKADSYIQLDKLHTLSISTCKKLGELHPSCRVNVCKKYEAYMHLIRMDLYKHLPPKYESPNLKPKVVSYSEGLDYDEEFKAFLNMKNNKESLKRGVK